MVGKVRKKCPSTQSSTQSSTSNKKMQLLRTNQIIKAASLQPISRYIIITELVRSGWISGTNTLCHCTQLRRRLIPFLFSSNSQYTDFNLQRALQVHSLDVLSDIINNIKIWKYKIHQNTKPIGNRGG